MHQSRTTDIVGGVDDKTKIEILLKEYDTLQAEIQNRIKARFAIVGYLGALCALVLTQLKNLASSLESLGLPNTPVYGMCIVLILTVLLLGIWVRFGMLIKHAHKRICQIEEKINALAGDDLLVWQSRWSTKVLFHKFHK